MKTGKEKNALIAGMIGCFLYVIGDFLFAATGKNQSTESIGLMARVAYLTGTVCWGYVHAMFMNVALIFKFTFEKYGDMQAAAEIANKVFYCNAAPMLAAYLLCDVLLSAVMLALIWKGLLPLKNTAQRILASLCNPIAFAGIVGNLFTLLPWPLDQIDHGTESAGHLLVLTLGSVLLREMAKGGELKGAVQ